MREINTQEFNHECYQYFVSLGFTREETETILQKISLLKNTRKNIEEIKADIDAFPILKFSQKERNEFICTNAEILFNKYSLNVYMKIKMLAEAYGREEAGRILQKCPAVIRYGPDAYEHEYKIYKNEEKMRIERERRWEKQKNERDLKVPEKEQKDTFTLKELEMMMYMYNSSGEQIRSEEEASRYFKIRLEHIKNLHYRFLLRFGDNKYEVLRKRKLELERKRKRRMEKREVYLQIRRRKLREFLD